MTNTELLAHLKDGNSEAWNQWRTHHPEILPDLPGVDLFRLDLSGANLRGANLSQATLNLSNLNNADLSEANLREAGLYSVRLDNANLSKADLYKADLRWAALNSARLHGANLEQAMLTRTSFVRADLREVNLCNTDLEKCDLQRANLSDANLQRANLSGANLQQANLSGANLVGANLVGANLQQADLSGANLQQADLTQAILFRANLERAILTDASLAQANVREARLSEADLHAAELRDADLRGADVLGAKLLETHSAHTLWPEAVTDPLKIAVLQEQLTPEQEVFARQFAQERIAMLFSSAPVDEAQAVWHLRQAYEAAGFNLPPIRWFQSPLAFAYASLSTSSWDECVDDDILSSLEKARFSPSRVDIQPPLRQRIEILVATPIHAAVQESIATGITAQAILTRLQKTLYTPMQRLVRHLIPHSTLYGTDGSDELNISIGHLKHMLLLELPPHLTIEAFIEEVVTETVRRSLERIVARSTCAYRRAARYGVIRFLQENLQYNELEMAGLVHFACFNELVSGYRLGRHSAWLVRKPVSMERDEQGRLHSETDKCLRYRDGWGLSIRHGEPKQTEVERLIADLTSRFALVRLYAVKGLEQYWRDPRVIEPLLVLLEDREPVEYDASYYGDPSVYWEVKDEANNDDVLRAATSLLKKIIQRPMEKWLLVGRLLALFQKKQLPSRPLIAEVLGASGDISAVDPLIDALREKDLSVVSASAYALGALRRKRAVFALMQGLSKTSQVLSEPMPSSEENEKTIAVIVAIVSALGMIEDKLAIDDLIRTFQKVSHGLFEPTSSTWSTQKVVTATVGALSHFKDPRVVDVLIQTLERLLEKERFSEEIVEALIHLKARQAIVPLITMLTVVQQSRPQWHEERAWLLRALGSLEAVDAADLIILELESPNWYVRSNATEALGKLGNASAIGPLLAHLHDDSAVLQRNEAASLRASVVEALGMLGAIEAIEPLFLLSLQDPHDSFIQYKIIQALKVLGKLGAFDFIIACLQDKKAERRGCAARLLGELGEVQAVEPLIACLQDEESAGIREKIIWALGKLGDVRAIPPLTHALQDPVESVRLQARGSLQRLGVSSQ